MAGHSKFKNIQFRKGAQDAKRAKLFTKLAREITVSVKEGGDDPAANPRLRAAIIAGRKENMPNDNINRAINCASKTANGYKRSANNEKRKHSGGSLRRAGQTWLHLSTDGRESRRSEIHREDMYVWLFLSKQCLLCLTSTPVQMRRFQTGN